MQDAGRSEIVELDGGRSILLELSRQWPKYVMVWSVRQHAGESDFPLAGGILEHLPSAQDTADDAWENLREAALTQATTATESAMSRSQEENKRPSLLDRLLGRS